MQTVPALPDVPLLPRQQYLLKTLELKYDLFAYASAESELHINPDRPPFFSYFVPPPTQPGDKPLLERLKEATPAFIYGESGSGKTTIRYAVEALCRAMPNQTLVVSYTLNKPFPTDTATLWKKFTQALATDLFIQLVEQYHVLDALHNPELVHRLADYWYANIPNFRRKLERHLDKEQTDKGILVWWTIWKRAVVRYTPLTDERIAFLKQLLQRTDSQLSTNLSPVAAFNAGLELAQQLSFQQAFLLIDVGHSPKQQADALKKPLSLILQSMNTLSPSPISLYPKLFLPEYLQDHVNLLATSLPWLTSSALFAIIAWDNPETLQAIIAYRFRSAGSWIRGFNAIAGQDIAGQLDQLMIELAHQSPRQLLQVASLLIDVHAYRDATDPLITAVDWQNTRQMFNFGPPLPIPSTLPKKGMWHERR